MNSQDSENIIYFQTQRKYSNECGVHALNNMLGKHIFCCDQLNEICKSLSNNLINPHKHIFGGDYDVNILMLALQKLGYECNWIDSRRKSELTQKYLNDKGLFGFLINKQPISSATSFFTNILGFSGRHWITMRKINNQFFLLDSKRQKPETITFPQKFLAIEIELGSHIIEIVQRANENQSGEVIKTSQ